MTDQFSIHVDRPEDLAIICANLVKEGINFEAFTEGTGWKIVMNGGY